MFPSQMMAPPPNNGQPMLAPQPMMMPQPPAPQYVHMQPQGPATGAGGMYFMTQPQPQPQMVYQHVDASGQLQWIPAGMQQPQFVVMQQPAPPPGFMYVSQQPQFVQAQPQQTQLPFGVWGGSGSLTSPPPYQAPLHRPMMRTSTTGGSTSGTGSFASGRPKMDPSAAAAAALAGNRNKKQFQSNHPFDETDEFQACEDAPENRSRFTAANLPQKAVFRLRPARPPPSGKPLPPFGEAAATRTTTTTTEPADLIVPAAPTPSAVVAPFAWSPHSGEASNASTLFGFGPIGGHAATGTF